MPILPLTARTHSLAVLIILQLAAPGAALVWLALARLPTPEAGVAAIVAVAALVAGTLAVGIWVYPPLWLAGLVFACVFGIASFRAWRRVRAARSRWSIVPKALIVVLCSALGGVLLWHGVTGRLAPRGESFDLAAPLQGEGYCVISGGASPVLNFHMATLAPGREAYRGQSYGLDFIAFSRTGLRTRGDRWLEPLPRAPSAYRIFGAPIHAPCAGVVVAAVDGLPDQPAGVADRSHMAGNHVILQCEGYEVLLAHMRQGSLRVRAGERLDVDAPLGQVGNTGNTDEPHLHVSVQRPNGGGLAGAPIQVTFQGRYLARHACLAPPR